MDSYMKGAVEEYIENNRAVLEDMCERGVLSPADVEEHLESIRVNIEKNIESNKAYALLMMEMDRGKTKMKYNNNYVSLTEIAKLKNFKNPSYVIQSWLRDRNTLEFLFSGNWKTTLLLIFKVIAKSKRNYLTLRLLLP